VLLPGAASPTVQAWFDVEFRVLGNDGLELLYKCVTVTVKSLGKQAEPVQDTTTQVGRRNRTGSKHGAVYRDGSASVDPLHVLVIDCATCSAMGNLGDGDPEREANLVEPPRSDIQVSRLSPPRSKAAPRPCGTGQLTTG
jgi:hypothetical protein